MTSFDTANELEQGTQLSSPMTTGTWGSSQTKTTESDLLPSAQPEKGASAASIPHNDRRPPRTCVPTICSKLGRLCNVSTKRSQRSPELQRQRRMAPTRIAKRMSQTLHRFSWDSSGMQRRIYSYLTCNSRRLSRRLSPGGTLSRQR